MPLPPARSVHFVSVFALAALAGCGGKVRFTEDTSFDCEDVTFDLDAPISVCASGGVTPEGGSGQCVLGGALPDGREAGILCTAAADFRCELFLEGELACTCDADQLDFANTCPNGVPTCAGWRVDFANAGSCPE